MKTVGKGMLGFEWMDLIVVIVSECKIVNKTKILFLYNINIITRNEVKKTIKLFCKNNEPNILKS